MQPILNDLSCGVNFITHIDKKSCRAQTEEVSENMDRARRFADALISEIKAEMGRRDLSSRGLGRLIGKSSQYMSTRLDGGNPRTGERVPLGVSDLAAIADALGVPLTELVDRADRAVDAPPTPVLSLEERRRIAAERAAAAADSDIRLVAQQRDGLPEAYDPDAPPTHDEGADPIPDDDHIA